MSTCSVTATTTTSTLTSFTPLFRFADMLHHYAFLYPALSSWMLAMFIFHSLCLGFEFLDRRNLLSQYKAFHPTSNTPTYKQMLPRVLFNQLLLLLPCMLLTTHFNLTFTPHPVAPTSLQSLLYLVGVAPFLHEFMFYVAHRFILHSRWGFTALDHALHHSSKAHSAISAMYMSPPDFLLEIVLPYLLPLSVLSLGNYCNPTHLIMMLPLGSLGGLYEHSGYNFFAAIPVLDTRVHGLHHLYYHCSFADGVGSTSIFDAAFGTVCANLGIASPAWKQLFSWLTPEQNLQKQQSLSEPAIATH